MKGDECCGSGCSGNEMVEEVKAEGCGCCVNESEKVKAHFCPKCKSFDVKYVFEFKNLLGMIPKQRCGECGYTDNSFPLLKTTKKEIKDNSEINHKHKRKGNKK